MLYTAGRVDYPATGNVIVKVDSLGKRSNFCVALHFVVIAAYEKYAS